MKTSLTYSLAVVVSILPAAACDLCGVYNAPLAHGMVEQGFHVSIAEQFTRFGTLQLEGHEVSNPAHQRLDSSVTQVAAGYHFSDRFGLQLNLPVIYRSFRRSEGGAIDEGTESGIGDLSISANYVFLRRDAEKWSVAWNVLGGVKFPTGDPDRLREELEEETPVPGEIESAVHGHDLALGSGSYDGFVGTQLYARYQRWFFTAETQYAIRTRGEIDYRYANDLTWSGGPGFYLLFGEETTLALQANISGEDKGQDDLDGEDAEDTAITSVFIGPRLSFSWHGRLSAEVGAGFPVDIQNSALQAVPDYRIQGSVVWRF
jgi:hypothetical protein